ncbi:MAG: VOC family protein [Actinomycetota bacterium]
MATFPEVGMELTRLLVVSDVDRSREWDASVLGASGSRVRRDLLRPPTPRVVDAARLGGRSDRGQADRDVTPLEDPDRVSAELIFRVPDCREAYAILRDRGASFLTPPFDNGYEVRAFFRDPDGHLFEISSIAS